jgi:hypothetical protein
MRSITLTSRLVFGPEIAGGGARQASYEAPDQPISPLDDGMNLSPSAPHSGHGRVALGHRGEERQVFHNPHARLGHRGDKPKPAPKEHYLRPRARLGHRAEAPVDPNAGANWAPHMDRRGVVPHQEFVHALVRKGFSPEDAAAIAGNLMHESGGNQLPGHPIVLNPRTGGDSGDAAWGAAQWEGKRKAGLASPSMQAQVDHIWNEMHGRESAAYAAMKRARTVSEKAHIANKLYERPLVPLHSDAERRRLAEEAYRNHLANPAPPATAAPMPSPAPAASPAPPADK